MKHINGFVFLRVDFFPPSTLLGIIRVGRGINCDKIDAKWRNAWAAWNVIGLFTNLYGEFVQS